MESCKAEQFVYCTMYNANMKISHGVNSNIKEHVNITKR